MARHRNDSVVDATEAVKLILGGTSIPVPPGSDLLDARSVRPCVRLRMWVVNSISHEEFRVMVREVQGRRDGHA